MFNINRLALKIVVGAREQGTLNWEQEESFGRFYFSSHTFKFFCSPTYSGFLGETVGKQNIDN